MAVNFIALSKLFILALYTYNLVSLQVSKPIQDTYPWTAYNISSTLARISLNQARVITNRSNDTPATEALAELGWQNLETQRAKTKAKQMFKVLHDMAPNCLTDLFSLKKNITNYNLRGSSTSLQLPLPKTEFMKKSFSYDGAKLWNSLPEASRDCTSLSSFVRELEAHTFI
ncbi:predicted protein [Nematostella vectensis]|uniref:Uncharacterized protein n=1 Tax=Nematostella vectensis TaxID=45351 RepID=A7SZP4_NEMVE|nr:predicted protein [Nematostella vectensis]|eukprot:XP_001622926.1 predicted protein [Nematostella vectensis]